MLTTHNVPGLLSHDGGRTFATILHTLDRLGYYRTTTIEQQPNRSAITIMSSWGGPMNSIWLLSHESELF